MDWFLCDRDHRHEKVKDYKNYFHKQIKIDIAAFLEIWKLNLSVLTYQRSYQQA